MNIEELIKGFLSGFNLLYIIEENKKRKLDEIGADFYEILDLFEKIAITGRKIIQSVENYIRDVVLNDRHPRSISMESQRLEILDLVRTQRFNIESMRDELSHRNIMSAYVSSRSVRILDEFVWEKRGPLRRLREYFDDGFAFERTAKYLTEIPVSRIRKIDNEINNIDKNELTSEHFDRVLNHFDLGGAKNRIDDIEKEIQNWRDVIEREFDKSGIHIEMERRGNRGMRSN